MFHPVLPVTPAVTTFASLPCHAQIDAPAGQVATFELHHTTYLLISSPVRSEVSSKLTKTERDVARWLLEGASLNSIALRRGVAARTVANQIQSIYRKMNVHSREEFAAQQAVAVPVARATKG